MIASPRTRSFRHWVAVSLATVLGYALLGRLAIVLAIGPSYASPLYPAAGLALAMCIAYGWRIVPAIVLGSFLTGGFVHHRDGMAWIAVGAAIAAGAGLQAAWGAALVRRFVRQPLALSEPRDIALFFIGGAFVACTLGATTGTAALALAAQLPRAEWAFTWLTWWTGDSLGTLIFAPITLTLVGEPHSDWAPRRRTVGLTLAFVALLLGGIIWQVLRWEESRARATFDRESRSAMAAINVKLQESVFALRAMRGVYAASQAVDAGELHEAAAPWLGSDSSLLALGFAERAASSHVPQLEARAQAEGQSGYRVKDRRDDGLQPDVLTPPGTGDEVFAIRRIEPPAGNAQALGVNLMSMPPTRRAIGLAVASGEPAATAAFLLTQATPAAAARTGIVVYDALYRTGMPPSASPSERRRDALGVVFTTLRVDDVMATLQPQLPAYLRLCLFDADPLAPLALLAGGPRCNAAPAMFLYEQAIPFAGRQWRLRIDADPAELPNARQSNAWLFSLVGLLSAGVLGALLLTVTGRTRRIEAAVRERTAALEQQVREREQAEAAMRESEQRFRNIFNNVPLGVVYTDLDGRVRQTNPHFCELVGHSAEALLTMNARDFTHPDDAPADREAVRQLLAGERTSDRRQERYITKSGHIVWVQSTLSLLRDERGAPQRIVSTVEDITDNLRLADADRARRAAEAANRAKSDFLSRMSHELRTPLNAMLGFAQLLDLDRRHPLAEAQRPWVGQIQQAGWHLLEMINDVLDLSRIESGNLRLAVEPLDLHALLQATLPLLQRDAQARGVQITDELTPAARRVLGDATRVKQILTNLLSNAIKYNIDGGRVHVASARVGDAVEITVTDTGLGMTPSQVDELFQPFNRLGREHSVAQGTGIGLVISQRLAELMGGGLHAHSATGIGSSFVLTLPHVDRIDSAHSPLDELAPHEPAYHRRRVHYVEDNETNVEVMRGILAQRPQVLLDVSTTGLEGLAAIAAQQPDVVLLDMHLPDISGMELLRRLQLDPATARIPVVVVSADAMESKIAEAQAFGAHRYLTKPVNVSELLSVLDGVLGEAETQFG